MPNELSAPLTIDATADSAAVFIDLNVRSQEMRTANETESDLLKTCAESNLRRLYQSCPKLAAEHDSKHRDSMGKARVLRVKDIQNLSDILDVSFMNHPAELVWKYSMPWCEFSRGLNDPEVKFFNHDLEEST